MLPTTMASAAGAHTARKGEIQRPVLLLCFITGPRARPLWASQTWSVLSRDVLTMRCEPAESSSTESAVQATAVLYQCDKPLLMLLPCGWMCD